MINNSTIEYKYYTKELFEIQRVCELNDFSIMLTVKDKRGLENNSRFRLTDQLDIGYERRSKVIKDLMNLFKRAYKIKKPLNSNSDFYYYAINETGLGDCKQVHKDSAHIHILIGFYNTSVYKECPDAHIDEFIKMSVKGGRSNDPYKRLSKTQKWCGINYKDYKEFLNEGYTVKEEFINGRRKRSQLKDFYKLYKPRFPYLDLCTSYRNNKKDNVILFKDKVIEYFSKAEQGLLNGSYFYKKPIFGGDIVFPKREEYPLELLSN